jgi:hypothetical protein
MRTTVLFSVALALAPLTAAAEDVDAMLGSLPPLAAALLQDEAREAQAAGLIAACMIGATDPEIAIATLEEAGWNPLEGADDTLGFDRDGSFASVLTVSLTPGFCMVETDWQGTEDALATLLGTLDGMGWPVGDIADDGTGGCPYVDLRIGVLAQISSAGNDPTCTSATVSAIRFTIADI